MTTVQPHTRDDGQALLVISGDVDLTQAGHVKDAGLKLLTGAPDRMLLDLLDVSFMDCTGLSCLIALRNAALHQHTELALLDPSPHVMFILNLAGMASGFPIECTPVRPVGTLLDAPSTSDNARESNALERTAAPGGVFGTVAALAAATAGFLRHLLQHDDAVSPNRRAGQEADRYAPYQPRF